MHIRGDKHHHFFYYLMHALLSNIWGVTNWKPSNRHSRSIKLTKRKIRIRHVKQDVKNMKLDKGVVVCKPVAQVLDSILCVFLNQMRFNTEI